MIFSTADAFGGKITSPYGWRMHPNHVPKFHVFFPATRLSRGLLYCKKAPHGVLAGLRCGRCAAVSVMEQADVGHRHCDAVFVAGLDDVVVADGAAALRDVGDAALMRALDVVAEREEGI